MNTQSQKITKQTQNTKQKKNNIVMDDNIRIKDRANNKRSPNISSRINDNATLILQQFIKEKQLLKQWKLARMAQKKSRSIIRTQSRDNAYTC